MAKNSDIQVYLPLEGVESEHCSLIVDNGLDKVDGVLNHKVELNNQRAVVSLKDDDVLPVVIKTIRGLGYGVTTVKKNIPVLKMTCASCAVSVESMIKALSGVVDASVNFSTESVTVEYLPNMVKLEDIREAVRSIGYDLFIEQDDEGAETLESIHEKKFTQLKRKTAGAVILSLPVVVIGMFFMNMPYANYIMLALTTPVVAWFGKDFFVNAWKQAKHHSANMDTLVAVSTGVAYLFSVFNTLLPGYWHRRGLHAHVYFEAAAVVIAFILLGKLLEEKVKGKTSTAIKKLIGLQPKTVTVIHDGGHQMFMPIEKVGIGNIILVKPGEKIAVDGTVTEGSSYVDESMLSGEPVAVMKTEGEQVFAGTINQKGSFRFKAEKVGAATMLAQIIKMVQDAQGSKAPVQKLVDKIAAIFVPVVIIIAFLALVVWVLAGGENGFTQGLLAFVTVLVIACPCALGLATPTAIMVGVGKGAANGILIKDAESLELTKHINVVILDKTGTITEGKPQVTDIAWLNNDDTAKHVLFSIEQQSEHPLAQAVTAYFNGLPLQAVSFFESITGKGAQAVVNGRRYYAGNRKLLVENEIQVAPELLNKAEQWGQDSKTVVWFADDEKALAALAITDKIKDTSVTAIQKLQSMGIEVYMLTGDNEATAKAVSGKVGIHHYQAEVLPEEKAGVVKKLQSQGKKVAMVGDGINDSTALAQADVSIAMGKGSDIAMDVAKMTIISSDLSKIPQAIQLSKQTVATIKQNLFWAFIYNVVGIPIAAGVLYPFFGFLLNPMIAGAAMAMSSVSVVANSLRLKLKG